MNTNNCVYAGVLLNYVLELEDDCWYIGYTTNLNVRIADHILGKASKWTNLHKFKRIEKVVIGNRKTEDILTKEYMDIYGKDKVRGGSWCRIERKTKIHYILKCIDSDIFN